jgi:peptidoglycan/LPS O-acetylase OafA/YrhL
MPDPNSPSQAVPGPQSAVEFKARSYFDALDGLRALAIFLVLFHHVPRVEATHWLHTLQENGRYGVSYFFAISGFLICTLFLREEDRNGRIDLWRFYGRRAARLLPVYYVALLVQALLVFVLHQHTPEHQALFREKLPAYLFYYSNWLPTATDGPFFCAWSLAVEEQFYLGFGFLLFFVRRHLVIGIVIAALLAKAFVYQMWGNVDVGSTLWRVIFSYQEPILLGVLLAFLLHGRKGYEFCARWLGSGWISATLGGLLAGWMLFHSMATQSTWDAQLLYLLMTLTLVSLVVRRATPILGSRFLIHVGKVSYGIYLFHMFVISIVKKLPGGGSPWICLAATSIAVIAIASVIFKYFEHPIILYFKPRFSPRTSQIAGAPLVPLPLNSLPQSGTGG